MWLTQGPVCTGKMQAVALTGTGVLNIALIVLLLHLQAFSTITGNQQSPAVAVSEQQGVPLLITVNGIDISDPHAPKVKYMIQNVSSKTVRAYTVLEESQTSKGKGTGSTIVNLTNEEHLFQPMDVRSGLFDGLSLANPLVSLTLSIDYVEFGDGSSWGKDTQRTGENLAGQLEGRKQTAHKIRDILERQGIVVLTGLMKQGVDIVNPPDGHSLEWRYGFQIGHNVVLYRLKTAYETGGAQRLTSELTKQTEEAEGKP